MLCKLNLLRVSDNVNINPWSLGSVELTADVTFTSSISLLLNWSKVLIPEHTNDRSPNFSQQLPKCWIHCWHCASWYPWAERHFWRSYTCFLHGSMWGSSCVCDLLMFNESSKRRFFSIFWRGMSLCELEFVTLEVFCLTNILFSLKWITLLTVGIFWS